MLTARQFDVDVIHQQRQARRHAFEHADECRSM
jgi:hypothetical protein